MKDDNRLFSSIGNFVDDFNKDVNSIEDDKEKLSFLTSNIPDVRDFLNANGYDLRYDSLNTNFFAFDSGDAVRTATKEDISKPPPIEDVKVKVETARTAKPPEYYESPEFMPEIPDEKKADIEEAETDSPRGKSQGDETDYPNGGGVPNGGGGAPTDDAEAIQDDLIADNEAFKKEQRKAELKKAFLMIGGTFLPAVALRQIGKVATKNEAIINILFAGGLIAGGFITAKILGNNE